MIRANRWILVCGILICTFSLSVTIHPLDASANEFLLITDALGRQVQLEQLPERIVIAGKAFHGIADAVYLFPEAVNKVVAMPNNAAQSFENFLALLDPSLHEKAVLEGLGGPEQIAPLKPDVVVMKTFMKDQVGDPLEQVGIPVVYVELETPEQYLNDLVILGQLLNNPQRAQEVVAYYEANLSRINVKLADLQEGEMPTVLLLYYSDRGGSVSFNVAPASWMQTRLVEMGGGHPVWAESTDSGGWMVVSFEQIAAWNPEQIYMIDYRGDSSDVVVNLKQDLKWRALPAVQANELYGFPADAFSWDQSDPRWILGLTWLSATMNPERFSDLDIIEEVYTFFEQMYGLDRTTIEAQILPTLKGTL